MTLRLSIENIVGLVERLDRIEDLLIRLHAHSLPGVETRLVCEKEGEHSWGKRHIPNSTWANSDGKHHCTRVGCQEALTCYYPYEGCADHKPK